MASFPQRLRRLHEDSAQGRPVTMAGRCLLWLAALLSRVARWAKKSLYDFRILPRVRLDCLTVSIGNITTGGTGKTPLAAWIAHRLRDLGASVVLLSRGYGRDPGPWARWASLDGRLVANPRQCGDESYLLARALPAVDVLVGKRRAITGRCARRLCGAKAVILDDGYQYWRLHRDLDILTLDLPLNPARLRSFPVGVLREPVTRLAGADFIVLTGAERATPQDRLAVTDFLDRVAPGIPRAFASYSPVRLRPWPDGAPLPVEALACKTVVALAALGRPSGFFDTLSRLEAKVLPAPFPDHHRFRVDELEREARRAQTERADFIVMTAKDEGNLPPGYSFSKPAVVLDVELSIEATAEGDLEAALVSALKRRHQVESFNEAPNSRK